MKERETFLWAVFRDMAYKEANPKLKLAALKMYRGKIDNMSDNPFRHDELDADIKELEIQCQE